MMNNKLAQSLMGENSIWELYNTPLNLKDETQFQIDKYYSPFRNDSGYDYNLRGYWKDRGHLYPNISTINNHLGDEYKKPNHPTFSTYSNYYTGQPYAVNWKSEPYKSLGEWGIL